MGKEKQIVAAFDFDGTITYRDTLLPFLLFSTGYWQSFLSLSAITPTLISYLLNFTSRQQAKEAALTRFFAGMPIDEFLELGKAYAYSSTLNKLIRPDAIKALQQHQRQNHRCILISAAIDTYLVPWSKSAGFNDAICSRVEVSSEQTVTGKLLGLNCWGAEKTRRLIELLGPKENYTLYAYGDSKGDIDLLGYADYPSYRVF